MHKRRKHCEHRKIGNLGLPSRNGSAHAGVPPPRPHARGARSRLPAPALSPVTAALGSRMLTDTTATDVFDALAVFALPSMLALVAVLGPTVLLFLELYFRTRGRQI